MILPYNLNSGGTYYRSFQLLKLENGPTSVSKLKVGENSLLANLDKKTAYSIPKTETKTKAELKSEKRGRLQKSNCSKKKSNSKSKIANFINPEDNTKNTTEENVLFITIMLTRSRRHENSVFHLTLIQFKFQESG